MMTILIVSCSKINPICNNGLEVIKLSPSEQPREELEKIAHLNCTLHDVCGYDFKGSNRCPN